MAGRIVSFRPNLHALSQDEDEHSPEDHIHEYILDMLSQLAELAEANSEPLLGAMLDHVRQRHRSPPPCGPATTPTRTPRHG